MSLVYEFRFDADGTIGDGTTCRGLAYSYEDSPFTITKLNAPSSTETSLVKCFATDLETRKFHIIGTHKDYSLYFDDDSITVYGDDDSGYFDGSCSWGQFAKLINYAKSLS